MGVTADNIVRYKVSSLTILDTLWLDGLIVYFYGLTSEWKICFLNWMDHLRFLLCWLQTTNYERRIATDFHQKKIEVSKGNSYPNWPVADQGFPRREGPTPKPGVQTYFLTIFPPKMLENGKKIDQGGAHPFRPLRCANVGSSVLGLEQL